MSTQESPQPLPPQSPSPPPPPPPRRLPVGATLLPSDFDFVVMTEIVIEEGDLMHDLIKERSAYIEHPSVLLASDTPAVPLRRQHVFIGTRQKQKSLNEITFSRLVGELGHWKQAGGKMDIKNDQGVVSGWVSKYDFYEYLFMGDKTGKHTCYRMKEYHSNKFPLNEKCIFTLEYLDKDRKEKLVGFESGLNMFKSDCDSKPKVAAAAKKCGKATRNEKGKEKVEEKRVTEAIGLAEGRVTRSQARHVKTGPMFSVIPKKPRGRPGVSGAKNVFGGMIAGEQMYPLLESFLFEFLKARGVEVGEGSGLLKEGLVEGDQNVRCDKEEEGHAITKTVSSKPDDKEEEGGCGVLRSDKEKRVILIDSDSEDDESGPEKLNDKCGPVKTGPMFSVIPKKPRGRPGVSGAKNVAGRMIAGEQMYPVLEGFLFESLKARGVEVGEGSGLLKEGLVEGDQNVRCDKEEEGHAITKTVLSKPDDKEEEGGCGVLRSDKETRVVLIDSDSEDESGLEKLNDKCGPAKD